MSEHVLGVARAGQIDLDSRVDRDDVVVLSDDARIVDVVDGPALDRGVVVQELVHALLPHREREHGLAAIERLAPVGDDAGAHEIDQAGA